MIEVIPIKQRYSPQSGDIVVGRIIELADKKWRVFINSTKRAYLNLNSIDIGGIQRRRTEEDELNMRDYFKEDDIVVLEVSDQKTRRNDITYLKAKKKKNYSKLRNGMII